MSWSGFFAVGLGGAIGCWMRWILGLLFNPVFPTLPLGTLAANLSGGLLMGGMMSLFEHFDSVPPELKLLAMTGFLGGLTTFSTFSAEAATLLLRGQWLWFGIHIGAHLLGSLSMTCLGLFLTRGLLHH